MTGVQTCALPIWGHYSITVPIEIPEEMAIEANESPESFREFVVHYAKIEVL